MIALKQNTLSWIKSLIGWPLSFISIFFIVKLIVDKSSDLNINLSNLNLFYLTASVFLFFIYYLMRSFLWREQLKEKGYKINFRENTYRFAFSELKRYAPGNIWSILSRATQFGQIGVDKKTIGVSILADIQLVIIGCGIVSLLSIPWLLDSPIELRTKLASLLPISAFAVVIFFIVTGIIYAKSTVLHSTRLLSNFLLPGFTFNSKIKLSLLAVLTYFIFGMGNYFSFLSIFPTDFSSFVNLTSFFVFSLLVGYLSFITPMGLGIREGVVTLGLSKIMSLSNAGVVAVYTRIILIISELFFLVLIFLWQKSLRKQ